MAAGLNIGTLWHRKPSGKDPRWAMAWPSNWASTTVGRNQGARGRLLQLEKLVAGAHNNLCRTELYLHYSR